MSKRVLITGGNSGIGFCTAEQLAGRGAEVILACRDQTKGQAAVAKIKNAHPQAKVRLFALDLADLEQVRDCAAELYQELGHIDVLINNAGVIEPISHLAASDPDEWSQVIDINLKGVYNGMRAVLPVMKNAGGGSILTISSGAAHHAIEAWSHYCASKAAVNMMGRSIHLEEAANGIRAIGLSPGTVATQMQREIKASGVNPVSELAWEDHIPADWPARALLWMCSADADTYCGEEISLRDEGIRKTIGLV